METVPPEGPAYDPEERICTVSAAIAARSLRLDMDRLPCLMPTTTSVDLRRRAGRLKCRSAGATGRVSVSLRLRLTYGPKRVSCTKGGCSHGLGASRPGLLLHPPGTVSAIPAASAGVP